MEDEGFTCLVKELKPRYFIENVVMKLYENIKEEVFLAVSSIEHFSFTTDIRSMCAKNELLPSFTAHWVTDTFQYTSIMLDATRTDGSHTRTYIAQKIKEILESRFTSTDQVHIILCDNGSNMVRAIKDGRLHDLGCFAHVHDGVLSQREVVEHLSLAICREVVEHLHLHMPDCIKFNRI